MKSELMKFCEASAEHHVSLGRSHKDLAHHAEAASQESEGFTKSYFSKLAEHHHVAAGLHADRASHFLKLHEHVAHEGDFHASITPDDIQKMLGDLIKPDNVQAVVPDGLRLVSRAGGPTPPVALTKMAREMFGDDF